MVTLTGLISMMLCAIWAGKRAKDFGLRQYFFIAFLAILQLCVVLYVAYTRKMPPPL